MSERGPAGRPTLAAGAALEEVHRVFQLGDLPSALRGCQDLIAVDPTSATVWSVLGHCLFRMGLRQQARSAARRAATLPILDASVASHLGTLFSLCDLPADALPLFERALSNAPDDPHHFYNVATAKRMTGDLIGAESAIDRYLELRPTDGEAHLLRADLRRQTSASNHVRVLVGVLKEGVSRVEDQIGLLFALAKELEDVAKFDVSFEYRKLACALKRRTFRYSVSEDIETLSTIVTTHDPPALANGLGFDTVEPLFIIGLPRSGTTLVEQILAQHSHVTVVGETRAFAAELIRASREFGTDSMTKRQFVSASLHIPPAPLGRAYMSAARPESMARKTHFVDKTPDNFLYAGLMHRALPGARFVALVRDPMDSCYAMYKTLFPHDYPFSYDLTELGSYYLGWRRLMRHWKQTLGAALLLVSYEDLVTRPDVVIPRLLEHCGLPFEKSCLTPHASRYAVMTASAAQIRQPIHTASVGLWHRYEHQLQPLAEMIAHLKQLS